MLVDEIILSLDGVEIPQKYIIGFNCEGSWVEHPQKINLEIVKKLEKHEELYQEGKTITLKAAYKGRFSPKELFSGLITKPNKEQRTIKIQGQCYLGNLTDIINESYKKMNDSQIIKKITGNLDLSNVQTRGFFKKRRYNHKTKKYVIADLARMTNSVYFTKGNKLFYGKKYSFSESNEIPVIDLSSPYIIDRTKLEYHKGSANIKIKVYGTDNNKSVVGVAGKGKIIKKYSRPDLGKSAVKDEAKKLYEQLTFNGYKGSVKMMLEPLLYHSEKVILQENDVEREVYIDKVRYTFSMGDGLKQEVFFGLEDKEKKAVKKAKRKNRRKRKKKKKKSWP